MATLCKGYDLDYMWRQAGASAGTTAERTGAGYYLAAAEQGEPPGRWWGPGAEALGFACGQVVEREPYDLLFGVRKAPDGMPLGRRPGGQLAAEVYGKLLAAEPHATAERRRELRIEAAARARQSPLYFDLTLSLSKSISIFHASLGENARLAHLAGDAAGEAYWAALVAEVDQMIWDAVSAGFGYFHREAGYTRTGSHASRAGGRETGQWREADLAVAHWLQHTSRDGDMQLHVHSQIAHISRTRDDGKWRAPDSYGYNEHIGATGAIVSQHLEEALTRRFGLAWTARDDGHGFEITGISGEMMRVFSSRRESITQDLRVRAREFEQRSGRAPSQRELAQLAQASNFATRAVKGPGALDFAQLHASWARTLDGALGMPVASVAPSVWGDAAGPQTSSGGGPSGTAPAGLVRARAAQKAIALAHQEKATFTRADLIKHLGRVLPRTGMEPSAAAQLLEDLADRALASEFEQVICLEAPEAVPVPACLLRADGRSLYQRHGGVKYAARVQLSLEERLVEQARGRGAPCLGREEAARILGADIARLDAALARRAAAARSARAGGDLREDQAAAVYAVLTSDQRVSVINAPAGSGKTHVLAAAAGAWSASGRGRVIGITPSQSSRNTLAAKGPESYNLAQFLGHLPDRRGARGAVELRPGDLVVGDETSMWSNPDLADVISQAARSGAKVLLAGDTQQLQAVESGGGMALLAETLGYVQLAEPVRFGARWERDASLRLRAGDISVLADYDEQGRIRGGDPELMTDQAAQAYVALALEGRDVLLMAADHARRRELCRRIREDLIHLGVVSDGPAVTIADRTRASVGDLIVCTENDHTTEAGEPGRMLANGDLLRIEAITARGPIVRRMLDADQVTGQRRWTDRQFLYGNYKNAELGYAVTDHVAQSRTVHTGLALITGTEDRQHAYVALTRGTASNLAFVFTQSPKLADPAPGPRAAPELDRYDRVAAQRDGLTAPPRGMEASLGYDEMEAPDAHAQAISVLAGVVSRDGQERSATQTWERNLSNADHLAVLNAIWTGETALAREQRYRDQLAAAIPAGYQQEPSHQARWLWRTLRTADLAGLDTGQILRQAVGERDLAWSRDVAAVIDARLRARVNALVPRPPVPWSQQVPDIADPERRDYVTRIASMMYQRKDRIGEHAAQHPQSWAVTALGPVPEDPLDRLRWEKRASSIGAYRELYGYDQPTEPIGPEPAGDAPDKRAAWHEAFAALGPADGPDLRGLPDGSLLHMRDTYPTETAWAPPWVGDQLRQVRQGAEAARLAAIRARAESAAAGNCGQQDRCESQRELGRSYLAMEAAYRQREAVFADVMSDRAEWDRATVSQRRLAIAADAEIRRRHPDQHFKPLRSAEPVTEAAHDDLPVTDTERIRETSQLAIDLAGQRTIFAEKLADRHSLRLPAHEPDYQDLGPAFTPWAGPDKDAILQPAKPQIPPAAEVMQRVADCDADMEAGN